LYDRSKMMHYSARISWSEEDGAFVARCPEFPGVAADGPTPQEAVAELQTVLGMAVELLEEDGRPLPEPRLEPTYSGNLSLRLGSDLHRRVADRAEVEGTSINSLIQTAIAYYLGLRAGAGLAGLAGGWEGSEELADAVDRRIRTRRSREEDRHRASQDG
jgi:predicted RNase H-like HicB family nuclease